MHTRRWLGSDLNAAALRAGAWLTGAYLGIVAPLGAMAQAPSCQRDAMIVFDSSGSMQIRENRFLPRIEIAKEAMRQVLPRATAHRRTGLIVYGAGENCSVELKLPLLRDAAPRIIGELEKLWPGSRTPITQAVGDAAANLGGKGIVVLVTDGEETCRGAPCTLARQLKAAHPELVVHVIGFHLGAKAARASACLARETGGRLVSSKTLEELVAALRQALDCPQVSHWSPLPATPGYVLTD